MTKIVIYCRVSSDSQVQHGNGLKSQEHTCQRYLEAKGYGRPQHIFKEEGVSGKDLNRPAFNEMIAYCAKHMKEGTIICADDMSRFTRNIYDMHDLYEFQRKFNIKFITPTSTLDETPAAKLTLHIGAAADQYQREANREQVIRRMKARADDGFRCYGKPPSWYEYKKGVMVPFEPNASIIKNMYQDIADGSLSPTGGAIRDYLFKAGFTNKKTGIIQKPTKHVGSKLLEEHTVKEVSGLVKNSVGEWITGQHEAIIGESLAERVLARISTKPKKAAVYSKLTDKFPLRRFLKCACCGNNLTASNPNKGKYSYYHCITPGCDLRHKNFNADTVHNDFIEKLHSIKATPKVIEMALFILKQRWEDLGEEQATQLKGLKRSITALGRQIDKAVDGWQQTNSKTIKSRLEASIEDLENQRALYEEKISKLQSKRESMDETFERLRTILIDPVKAWQSASLAKKYRIQEVIFGNSIIYDKETKFRNANLTPVFRGFVLLNEGDVPFGGAKRDRTADLIAASDALSQLSYSPTPCRKVNSFYSSPV